MKDATKTFHTAQAATADAAKGARGGLIGAIKSVAEVVTVLRGLGGDEVLRKIGLLRGRTPLASLGLFGTGVVLGAGLGVMFAPMTGQEARNYMRARLRDITNDAKTSTVAAVEQVEEKVDEVLDKVEDAALRPDEPEEHKTKKARRQASADKMAS
jgi:gas vesicle protein